jgi:signal transduction histidine kinase
VDDLPADLVAEVAAVVGEALTNTARHAHATEATVHLDSHGGTLDISVTDNGVGPSPAGPCGSGLGNLAERAAAWGGTSTLDAGADCGAVLRWTVPLDIS